MSKVYTNEDKITIINNICDDISDGDKLRECFKKYDISSRSFFRWIEDDENLVKQYARAMELRAELMGDEILNICDATQDDIITDENGNLLTNHNVIQRDRLRVDTRKWLMSKMKPKKYGDKTDITTNGEKIEQPLFYINKKD